MKAFKFVIAGAVAASVGAIAAVVIKKITSKTDASSKCDCCDSCPDCDCHDVIPERTRREILTDDFDVPALREEAKSLGIKRVWRMKKSDLIDAIISAEEDCDDEYVELFADEDGSPLI